MNTASIIFSSLKAYNGQSVLSRGIAQVFFKPNGAATAAIVSHDTIGLSTGQIDTLLGTTIVDNTMNAIFVCVPTQAAKATNKISYDAIAALDAKIVSGLRGSVNNAVRSNTCQANATTTNIVLDASASAVDNAYQGKYIKTTVGGVSTYHYCTGYTGASKIAVVADTGIAVTSTSTFIVYTQPYVYLIGDAVSNETASRVAWTTLFPNANIPPLVSLMGGYGSGYQPHFMVTQTADSFTISSVTKAGAFTAGQFNGGNFYLAVESATTGAGQVVRILSNTANVITTEPFVTLPTGTLVFQVCAGNAFCLYEQYLKYAVMTYLSTDNAISQNAFQQLLDKLSVMPKGELNPAYNATMLKMYGDRGRAVVDTINGGYVTA